MLIRISLFILLFFSPVIAYGANEIYSQPIQNNTLTSTGGFESITGTTTFLALDFPAPSDPIYIDFFLQTDCAATSTCLNGAPQVGIITEDFSAQCWTYQLTAEDKDLLVSDNAYHRFQVPTNFNPGTAACATNPLVIFFYNIGNSFGPFHGHTKGDSLGNPYFLAYRDGIPGGIFATRFTNQSFVGTSSISAEVTYFLNTAEVIDSDPTRNPTNVRITLSKVGSTTTETFSVDIDNTDGGTSTTSISIGNLADGVYDTLTTFGNLGSVFGGVIPFKEAYVYSQFVVSGGVLTTQSPPELYNALALQSGPGLAYQYQDCGITAISGCINNAFAYLFMPDDDLITSAYSEYQLVRSSTAPFATIEDVRNVYATLQEVSSATNTPPEVSLVLFGQTTEFTLGSEIPNDARIFVFQLSTAMLWVAFGLALWSTRFQLVT